MNKWVGISLGTIVGVTHVAMIGLLATRNTSKLPALNVPVGPYTSYVATADENGYKISYQANDPKTMHITKDIVKPSGFLGFGKSNVQVVEEYVMDGATNQGGPVSNARSWQDGSAQPSGEGLSKKSVECIEAVGGGKQTGRIVGTSIGTAAAPALSSIPFVGWVAAGWVAMFGGEQGSNIGGDMVASLNDACEVADGDTIN
tara:strand:- start:17 stop:622 length:606 start_codon:yes stop_codon:yes gene_type:complete